MDEEFAHDGGEGDFMGFTGGAQALVDGLEDGVTARGAQGCHVEGEAHFAASAADGAGAAIGPAVAIEGGEAGQGGDSRPGLRRDPASQRPDRWPPTATHRDGRGHPARAAGAGDG